MSGAKASSKKFPGRAHKKTKNRKKYPKIALLTSSRGGNGEKDRKIALSSLYLLYLYQV